MSSCAALVLHYFRREKNPCSHSSMMRFSDCLPSSFEERESKIVKPVTKVRRLLLFAQMQRSRDALVLRRNICLWRLSLARHAMCIIYYLKGYSYTSRSMFTSAKLFALGYNLNNYAHKVLMGMCVY